MRLFRGQSPICFIFRLSLALSILMVAQLARADWAGISMSIGETESNWEFSDFDADVRLTDIFLRAETRASLSLRSGFTFGQSSLRMDPPGADEVLRYETNFIGIDLRWPLEFGDNLSLETQFGWRWNSGSGTNEGESGDASWTNAWVGLAPAFQYHNLRFSPYWLAHYLDGDLGINGSQRNFSRTETFSVGANIDYLVSDTGFVRLNLGAGGDEGFLIEFIRRY